MIPWADSIGPAVVTWDRSYRVGGWAGEDSWLVALAGRQLFEC